MVTWGVSNGPEMQQLRTSQFQCLELIPRSGRLDSVVLLSFVKSLRCFFVNHFGVFNDL